MTHDNLNETLADTSRRVLLGRTLALCKCSLAKVSPASHLVGGALGPERVEVRTVRTKSKFGEIVGESSQWSICGMLSDICMIFELGLPHVRFIQV